MKKAFAALLATVAAALICCAAVSASDSKSPSVSYDPKTDTLTLKPGIVSQSDLKEYKKTAKHIKTEKGAVLPEDSSSLFKGFAAADIDLTNADTSAVTNMRWMFMDCKNLRSVDLSGIDTSEVSTMDALFIRCESLESIGLSGIDTSKLIDAKSMFEDCVRLRTLDLSSFDTSSVEYWECMFKGCSSLTTIYVSDKWTGVRDTYVTTWLTENLFTGCTSIKGGSGTVYDPDAKDDKHYARIDRAGEPGYLTYKAATQVSSAEKPAVKAPSAVSYKLVNHDKVSLKWNSVTGADGYYLYRLNKTGKYKKVSKLTKTSCTLGKLTADTTYTYAVTAYAGSGKNVTESKPCTVTFTTPEKWYYVRGKDEDSEKRYNFSYVYRQHYDGSGLEKFDHFRYLPKDSLTEDMTEDSYKVYSYEQKGGYLYLYLININEHIDDGDTYPDVYRFRNDGTGAEQLYISGRRADRSLLTDDGTLYMGYESGIGGSDELYITDSHVEKTVTDKNGSLRAVTLFKEPGSYISNFVADDEYIYFFTTPYQVFEYDSYDYGYEAGTLAKLYRIKRSVPDKLTYNDYGYLQQPRPDGLSECLCGINYDYTENGINIVGINGGNIYFTVRERENDDGTFTYSLWRIPADPENEMPKRLCRMKFETLADIRIAGDRICLLGDMKGYTADLSGSFKLKKIFTLPDGYFYNYDEYDVIDKAPPVEISGNYIYITSSDGEIYYRVKLNGKSLSKSSKPYLWR